MRTKCNPQRGLDFSGSHLKITNEYYAKYEAVSSTLDQAPDLVDRIHQDLAKPLQKVNRKTRQGRPYAYSSENVLRILVCQVIEGESLRGVVVRIDDSVVLRRFVRIDGDRTVPVESGIDPFRVQQNRVLSHQRHSALEVQHPTDLNGLDFVAVRLH